MSSIRKHRIVKRKRANKLAKRDANRAKKKSKLVKKVRASKEISK
jgi:hypothetical protein